MAADPYHSSLCSDTSCNCLFATCLAPYWASLVAETVKNLPAMLETWGQSLGQKDLLEDGMATHSCILAWRILWTVEPSGLQSMGSQIDTTERLNLNPLIALTDFHLFFFFHFSFV